MKVMQFQGMGKKAMPISLPPVENYDLTPSPDVPFAIMKRKLMATNDISEAKKIAAEMKAYLEVRKEKRIAHQARLTSVLRNGRRKIPESQKNFRLMVYSSFRIQGSFPQGTFSSNYLAKR